MSRPQYGLPARDLLPSLRLCPKATTAPQAVSALARLASPGDTPVVYRDNRAHEPWVIVRSLPGGQVLCARVGEAKTALWSRAELTEWGAGPPFVLRRVHFPEYWGYVPSVIQARRPKLVVAKPRQHAQRFRTFAEADEQRRRLPDPDGWKVVPA